MENRYRVFFWSPVTMRNVINHFAPGSPPICTNDFKPNSFGDNNPISYYGAIGEDENVLLNRFYSSKSGVKRFSHAVYDSKEGVVHVCECKEIYQIFIGLDIPIEEMRNACDEANKDRTGQHHSEVENLCTYRIEKIGKNGKFITNPLSEYGEYMVFARHDNIRTRDGLDICTEHYRAGNVDLQPSVYDYFCRLLQERTPHQLKLAEKRNGGIHRESMREFLGDASQNGGSSISFRL